MLSPPPAGESCLCPLLPPESQACPSREFRCSAPPADLLFHPSKRNLLEPRLRAQLLPVRQAQASETVPNVLARRPKPMPEALKPKHTLLLALLHAEALGRRPKVSVSLCTIRGTDKRDRKGSSNSAGQCPSPLSRPILEGTVRQTVLRRCLCRIGNLTVFEKLFRFVKRKPEDLRDLSPRNAPAHALVDDQSLQCSIRKVLGRIPKNPRERFWHLNGDLHVHISTTKSGGMTTNTAADFSLLSQAHWPRVSLHQLFFERGALCLQIRGA